MLKYIDLFIGGMKTRSGACTPAGSAVSPPAPQVKQEEQQQATEAPGYGMHESRARAREAVLADVQGSRGKGIQAAG